MLGDLPFQLFRILAGCSPLLLGWVVWIQDRALDAYTHLYGSSGPGPTGPLIVAASLLGLSYPALRDDDWESLAQVTWPERLLASAGMFINTRAPIGGSAA